MTARAMPRAPRRIWLLVAFIPEAAELTCRQRFVVESYSIIGGDRDFQLD